MKYGLEWYKYLNSLPVKCDMLIVYDFYWSAIALQSNEIEMHKRRVDLTDSLVAFD